MLRYTLAGVPNTSNCFRLMLVMPHSIYTPYIMAIRCLSVRKKNVLSVNYSALITGTLPFL